MTYVDRRFRFGPMPAHQFEDAMVSVARKTRSGIELSYERRIRYDFGDERPSVVIGMGSGDLTGTIERTSSDGHFKLQLHYASAKTATIGSSGTDEIYFQDLLLTDPHGWRGGSAFPDQIEELRRYADEIAAALARQGIREKQKTAQLW